MYGTVARLKVKPGSEPALQALSDRMAAEDMQSVRGYLGEVVYRLDSGDGEYLLAVLFTDRAAYEANAQDPRQHSRYQTLRDLLTADPEWHDGEVIHAGGRLGSLA